MNIEKTTIKATNIAIIDPVGCKAGMDGYDVPLCIGLASIGYKTYIFSNFESSELTVESGIQVFNFFGANRLNAFSSVYRYALALFKCISLCKNNKIKWVVLHQFNSNILTIFKYVVLKIFGFSIISILHDVKSFNEDDIKIGKNILLKWCSTLICVQNETIKQNIQQEYKSELDHKTFYASHGSYSEVISEQFSSVEARNRLNLPLNKNILLFFGQIKRAKGLQILLRSLEFLDEEYVLVIAGRPWNDDIQNYYHISDELGINSRVIYDIRYIPNNDRDLYFTAADALVLPYTEIYESGVMLMGMSFGLPIIASNIELFEQRVAESKLGITFETENPKDLAQKIISLFSDSALLKSAGVNGRELIESKFSWFAISKLYAKEIDKLEKSL